MIHFATSKASICKQHPPLCPEQPIPKSLHKCQLTLKINSDSNSQGSGSGPPFFLFVRAIVKIARKLKDQGIVSSEKICWFLWWNSMYFTDKKVTTQTIQSVICAFMHRLNVLLCVDWMSQDSEIHHVSQDKFIPSGSARWISILSQGLSLPSWWHSWQYKMCKLFVKYLV
jgi:hypothetical protein